MTIQVNRPSLSKPSVSGKSGDFCLAYRLREDYFTLIVQLNQMIKGVQRHRGMSMALLGGLSDFSDDFVALQANLSLRLDLIRAFETYNGGLLGLRDLDVLYSEWSTVKQNWQDDTVGENFELHCHLVEKLISVVLRLSQQLELPVALPSSHIEILAPRRARLLGLLKFCTRHMPLMIEQIGKIRGLATYTLAVKNVDEYYRRKLRFELQCTRERIDQHRKTIKDLSGTLRDDVTLLGNTKSMDAKLNHLVASVDKGVQGSQSRLSNSQQAYTLSTEIIDVLWLSVEEGFHSIRKWQQEELLGDNLVRL